MTKPRRPILVTGSHRSGSTWVGRMLSASPHTKYIHEPFNVGVRIGYLTNPFNNWFEYIPKKSSGGYELMIEKVLRLEYPLISNLKKAEGIGDIRKIIKEQRNFLSHKIRGDTPIIKDPIAFFSTEWLSDTFDMNVLVIIRHPAAFCSSLKIKGWEFDFNNFLNQPLLMDKYLSKYSKDISDYAKNKKSIIDQAILFWNCIYNTVITYQQNHPEWLYIRHEDISINPVEQFKSIYKKFNLEFTHHAESMILDSSGSHNPPEQSDGNELIRNSKKNVWNWKARLTKDEKRVIREKTYEVSHSFYTDREW